MADKYCGQVNIPTVNNDAIACPNYYDTNCVIYQDPIPYFGTVDPSTSTEVFNLLITSLQDARNRIVTLEGASTVNFDLVPTDGSTNAVQSNGIFDALALKLEDAPSDGTQYVRQDAAWVAVAGGASNVLVGDNVAVATTPLPNYTTGAGNTAFGDRALEKATTINGVVAIGDMAGFYAAATENPTETVTTELTIATDSIFIGDEAKPSANSSTNEIVIGAQAFGNGNNTVTLGDSRITDTYLRGDVTIDAGAGTGLLTTAGGALFNDSIVVQGGISVLGTVDGRDIAVDGTKLDGIEAGATADQIAVEVPITDTGAYFTATEVEGALQELAAGIVAGVSDGDKGDITVSGSGSVWTIDNSVVTFAKIQDVTTGVFVGRITSGAGAVEELSGADATTLLSPFSTTAITQGVVPGSNNVGAGYYLEADGTWSIPPTGGVGNTIYSADDALTGARIVDLNANQLTFTDVGGDVNINAGRLGVNTAVFGGSRLGDSFFQTPSIDTQSINIKDSSLNTFLAIFSSAVGVVPGDGVVTTFKNFTDSVNVISVAAQDADQTSGLRQVESTLALRNDYQDNSFTVLDMFNQDYPSGVTPLAQEMGWVAIHGGGATAKPIGLYRYDGTTYTNIWKLGSTNVLTYEVDINVPFEAYGVSWSGSNEAPTKTAVYTALEAATLTLEGYSETGTRSGGNLVVTLGDYDASFNSTQLIVDDAAEDISIPNSTLTVSGNIIAQQNLEFTSGLGSSIAPAATTVFRNYTLPDASGTLALTSDLNDLVTLSTGQTISGSKTFSAILTLSGDALRIDDGQIGFIPQTSFTGITTSYASLRYLGTPTHTWEFVNPSVSSSGTFRLNADSLTGIRTYTMPDATGTIALTSDITGQNLADLGDVTITGATTGEFLRYNGAAWVDTLLIAGDIPLLTDYVAVTGDNMTGDLTMSANILADTAETRNIGSLAVPFKDVYLGNIFFGDGDGAPARWYFQIENNVSDDFHIARETAPGSATWTALYKFNSSGIPADPTDIVDVAYVEANFVELTGAQSIAGVKSFTDSTASTTKDTGAVVVTTGGLGVEGAINAGGDITAFASSDPRLKDDMVRIKDPMAKLRLLTGYTFTWNDNQELYFGDDIGLKSTEVAEVIPSAVREGTHGYQQVDYKRVTPLMVEAIKEQQEELNQLRMQNKAMADEMRNIYKTVEFLMKRVTEKD